ncbi:MAG TPA: hypothetical protein VK797_25605 [Tepidisphaeraceae bacterium]|nr:hypothetical protein [Tepidisphaeraceae bacterium]
MKGGAKKSSRRSTAARSMLSRLKAGLDVRRAKVRGVRARLRDETYVNLLKLDVAAQRLADDLTSDP